MSSLDFQMLIDTGQYDVILSALNMDDLNDDEMFELDMLIQDEELERDVPATYKQLTNAIHDSMVRQGYWEAS